MRKEAQLFAGSLVWNPIPKEVKEISTALLGWFLLTRHKTSF
jgi:hypothetical protein